MAMIDMGIAVLIGEVVTEFLGSLTDAMMFGALVILALPLLI